MSFLCVAAFVSRTRTAGLRAADDARAGDDERESADDREKHRDRRQQAAAVAAYADQDQVRDREDEAEQRREAIAVRVVTLDGHGDWIRHRHTI